MIQVKKVGGCMRNRRIYHILALMEEQERRLFREFLQSPLFEKKKRLLRFFDLWEERVFGDENVEFDTVEEMLEGSDFSLQTFDKLCSQLRQKALEFFSFQAYQDSPGLQMKLTNQALADRKAPERERTREQERRRKWLAGQPESADTWYARLKFKWEQTESKMLMRQTRAVWKENFQDLHKDLDAFYYLQKLKLASATANARQMFQHNDDPAAHFLEFFEQSIDLDELSPLARAYAHTVQILTKEEPLPYFTALTELLKAHGSEFEAADARELYQYALNFTIRKSNGGKRVYRIHAGSLYRDLLEKGLLMDNGCLPGQTMKNIVAIHCAIGELDWVEGFIEAFRDRLVPGSDPNVVVYNEALLAYFRKDFDRAILMFKEVISKMKNDIFFELDARICLWKCYFEHYDKLSMEEVDQLERMYNSFRIFIDRNQKLSTVHKLRYRNFIREYKRLLGLAQQAPLPVDKLLAFREEYLEMESTFYKSWILEQTEALLARAVAPS